MSRFVVRRLLMMVLLLFVISAVTFVLFVVALPGGNPAQMIAGRLANAAEVHLISVRYGFDKPIWIQYIKTMGNIFSGAAYSYQSGYNVLTEIRAGLPVDEPEDYDLDVWAGVVPISVTFGEPVPDAKLRAETPLPAHIRDRVS